MQAEVDGRLRDVLAADAWIREHPLRVSWSDFTPPAEIPARHPLVVAALASGALVGRRGDPAGLDSWHDAATFTRAGTPTFSFGPDGIESAHAVDEHVSVQGLLDFTAATALTAMRWCGVASA